MNAIVRYAIARLLRERTAALIAAQQHAVVGIYRRPRKTLLRELTVVQQFLAGKGAVAAYAEALPEVAGRIREGRLRETTTGLVAVAFLSERHTDHHGRSRIGTVVFDDGAVAHLSADPDEAALKWELFEDGVQAADRWMIGLSAVLAALTGKPGSWGGAA